MGSRNHDVMVATRALAWFAAVCLAPTELAAQGPNDEVRWQLHDENDRVSLYAAAHEATDNIGSPSFSCQKGSGSVVVWNEMSDDEREAIADLIKKDMYPAVLLIPPAESAALVGDISYSAMYGWSYKFQTSGVSEAFLKFASTGVFTFMIGSYVKETELKLGVDNVAAFQRACRPNSR